MPMCPFYYIVEVVNSITAPCIENHKCTLSMRLARPDFLNIQCTVADVSNRLIGGRGRGVTTYRDLWFGGREGGEKDWGESIFGGILKPCGHGRGRGSKMSKNLSTWFMNDPKVKTLQNPPRDQVWYG